jgi:hypothetical protein
MPYRNNPFMPRKYTYTNNSLLHNESFNNPNINTESIKITDDIPLPNNIENSPGSLNRKQTNPVSSILSIFKDKITLEEIILIGVIIILLLEGIEDEFLLLMLAYILIF